MTGFFVTGTDTGVGKTWATVSLMRHFRAHGLSVVGMKPVASGCVLRQDGWRNEDALLLQENASLSVEYGQLNLYAFEPPVAPHIAADRSGRIIEVDRIVRQCRELERLADCVLVEGVGGWEVPLNGSQRVSHLAQALRLPIILVVGMRLGCLNHALLTHDAMLRSGVPCEGWIGNLLDESFDCVEENLARLKVELSFPCLGVIPRGLQSDENLRACFSANWFFSRRPLEDSLREVGL